MDYVDWVEKVATTFAGLNPSSSTILGVDDIATALDSDPDADDDGGIGGRWDSIMDTPATICGQDDALLLATPYRVVDGTDSADAASAVARWEDLTGRGGEGMVVKPIDFILPRGQKRPIQPAVKCRGRGVLRIIYGPEYDLPEHLERLRERGVAGKRGLAHRESVLGIGAMERFARGKPLHESTSAPSACGGEDRLQRVSGESFPHDSERSVESFVHHPKGPPVGQGRLQAPAEHARRHLRPDTPPAAPILALDGGDRKRPDGRHGRIRALPERKVGDLRAEIRRDVTAPDFGAAG